MTQKPWPLGKHSALRTAVLEQVNRFAEPRRLALALPELRTTFAGNSRVPDVSVYRWERIPCDEAGEIADDFLKPPDIAIESASPGQSANYLVRRCVWYVAHGVRAAVLLDPADDSALLFRPEQPITGVQRPNQIDLNDILPGFQLAIEDLFDALIPR